MLMLMLVLLMMIESNAVTVAGRLIMRLRDV